MEYCHLNLLDRVQRWAKQLICGVNLIGHQQSCQRQQHQRQQQQQQHEQRQADPAALTAEPAVKESMEHRWSFAVLTVVYKAKILQMTHLKVLGTTWKRSEPSVRAMLSNDSLLEVPRSHSNTHQWSFYCCSFVVLERHHR